MNTLKVTFIVIAMLAAAVVPIGPASGFTVDSAGVHVAASDVDPGQTVILWSGSNQVTLTDVDYQFWYSANADKYDQNGSTAGTLSGWSSAVYYDPSGSKNMSRIEVDTGSGTWAVVRTLNDANGMTGGWDGYFEYRFDLTGTGRTIQQLNCTDMTCCTPDGGVGSNADWDVSCDEGATWYNYAHMVGPGSSPWLWSSPNYNLTSLYPNLVGASTFLLEMHAYPYYGQGDVEFARSLGTWGGWGALDIAVTLNPTISKLTPAAAKTQSDNSTVTVAGIVTTSLTDTAGNPLGYCYIEDAGRTGGLRVSGNQLLGESVLVCGTMGTVNGERVLNNPTSIANLGAATVPTSLFLTNKELGGGNASQGVTGVTSGSGLNNLGLLVTTTGKITGFETVAAGTVLTIDDGFGVGVKIANINPLSTWITSAGTEVRVTGISSFWTGDGGRQAMIIPTEGIVTIGGPVVVDTAGVYNTGGPDYYELAYSVTADEYATVNRGSSSPVYTPYKAGWASCVYTSRNMARIVEPAGPSNGQPGYLDASGQAMYLGRESVYATALGYVPYGGSVQGRRVRKYRLEIPFHPVVQRKGGDNSGFLLLS